VEKVSNERKNLSRLAGEFLVASRLAQRGYMVSLQWGTTIGYDLLVFDKEGNVAYIEVKSSASYCRRWILQAKYANPDTDRIPTKRRFVCCVDLTVLPQPNVFVFPASVVAKGLKYFYQVKGCSKSPSYMFALGKKPRYRTKEEGTKTVGEYISQEKYLEKYSVLGVKPFNTKPTSARKERRKPGATPDAGRSPEVYKGISIA